MSSIPDRSYHFGDTNIQEDGQMGLLKIETFAPLVLKRLRYLTVPGIFQKDREIIKFLIGRAIRAANRSNVLNAGTCSIIARDEISRH